MDRTAFLTTCRRQALEIALGQPRIGLRFLDLNFARDEAVFRAGELGIDGSRLLRVNGLREAALCPGLFRDISVAFGVGPGSELLGELTAHDRIRLGTELRHLEGAVCSDAGEAPIS